MESASAPSSTECSHVVVFFGKTLQINGQPRNFARIDIHSFAAHIALGSHAGEDGAIFPQLDVGQHERRVAFGADEFETDDGI